MIQLLTLPLAVMLSSGPEGPTIPGAEAAGPGPQQVADPAPVRAQEQDAVVGPQAPSVDEPVAFWVHLNIEDPPPPEPVTEREWNDYVSYIRQIYPIADEVRFAYTILGQILDCKIPQLRHHRNASTVRRRAENIRAKLDEGADWNRMVRLHSEDENATSDGTYGSIQRRLSRYPLESTVFEGEVGDIVGPIYTQWGAEIHLIADHLGERRTKDESIVTKYILLKWGPTLGKYDLAEMRRKTTLSSDMERFRRILPPGMLGTSPEVFGPTDVAPLGDPNAILVQHSCDDRFHDKRPDFGDALRKSSDGSE